MAGRNSRPDNDGPAGKPGRLDQYGAKLGSSNEEEFEEAFQQNRNHSSTESIDEQVETQ
ncbi:hypothetical protein PaecuDRAFT_2352 [Paenibacillus curdlanolyticus YK9]|uniref:Uncharacterized protein n=1 Tax=Paenibacillus curdlanolyticus YK9 TaxID=717606 RepID=E0I9L5_9BACL|nr:hypothetical protein [Paenibacillus curdlanolyticus]EFM11099.1 hypothetical protein PaecuDRAFT_2352 [Paenibacillus curdlanolyticus YK9]